MNKQNYEELEKQFRILTGCPDWLELHDYFPILMARHTHLEAQVKQLAAENAALKELIEQHANCVAVCPNCCHEEPSETDDIVALYRSMETPATDAYAASLRAEGVEMFANHQQKKYDNLVSSGKILTDTGFSHYLSGEASTFASQLRSKSEVQS